MHILPADLDILARTIWGEARSEPFEAQVAIGHVVMNRVVASHRKETTIAGVATEPFQFSCWNPSDPNRAKLTSVDLGTRTFRRAYAAALAAMDGEDMTGGATHYHTTQIMPEWAKGVTPTIQLGNHLFYAGIH